MHRFLDSLANPQTLGGNFLTYEQAGVIPVNTKTYLVLHLPKNTANTVRLILEFSIH